MDRRFESLQLVNICKSFSGVVANDRVCLEVKSGEVHALLGENGAGKTTLMNILYGIYYPDSGEIYINGKRVEIRSTRDAIRHGIGMVHQHFMLVQNHTVAENICLGLKGVPFFDTARKYSHKIRVLSEKFNLKVNPEAKIWQLSAGEQQRVEILKALIRGAQVLILDEPTSVLTPQEAKELFKTVKSLVSNGHSVIFISHKLEEVFEISDRVTVLRKGKVEGTRNIKETSRLELSRMMVGKEIEFNFEKRTVESDRTVLEVKDLWVKNDRGLDTVRGISFKIKEGEILGIAGVSGNGQRELVEALTGLREIYKGTYLIGNEVMNRKNAKAISERKVAHIPEERIKHGTVPNLSVYENVILRDYYREPFSKRGFLNFRFILDYSQSIVNNFSVQTSSLGASVKLLSGGNIQKLILGREISSKSKIIIAAHPTYGLDIAATDFIRKLLIEKKNNGSSVLLVSEDLEEVLQISDKVIVMYDGRIMGEFRPEDVSLEDIGLMMTGAKRLCSGGSE